MSRERKTRNVSLTPELEAFIDGRVVTGRYRSASEVVRAALRLLEEDERRREPSQPGEPAMAACERRRGPTRGA
jgi:antitoxin ParD1/3/4